MSRGTFVPISSLAGRENKAEERQVPLGTAPGPISAVSLLRQLLGCQLISDIRNRCFWFLFFPVCLTYLPSSQAALVSALPMALFVSYPQNTLQQLWVWTFQLHLSDTKWRQVLLGQRSCGKKGAPRKDLPHHPSSPRNQSWRKAGRIAGLPPSCNEPSQTAERDSLCCIWRNGGKRKLAVTSDCSLLGSHSFTPVCLSGIKSGSSKRQSWQGLAAIHREYKKGRERQDGERGEGKAAQTGKVWLDPYWPAWKHRGSEE